MDIEEIAVLAVRNEIVKYSDTLVAYIDTKEKVYGDYEDQKAWNKKALINIAKAGFFSSDRTIRQYNEDIWHLN